MGDDLTQDIMLRLYTHLGRLRQPERLDAWAYQVARNVIADHWRERGAAHELPLDERVSDRLAAVPEPEDGDEAEMLRGEVANCLAPMVERLDEPYREAIRLTDLGARTQTEAAAALGLSVPGMKARVQRGRRQLGELLAACCRIGLDRRRQIVQFEHTHSSCASDASGCGCSARAEPRVRP